jgi:hypothetical protein
MSDLELKFTAHKSGWYKVTGSFTPLGGERQTVEALYEGNPYTDADARLVYGRDIVREGLSFTMNSGRPIDFNAEEMKPTLMLVWPPPSAIDEFGEAKRRFGYAVAEALRLPQLVEWLARRLDRSVRIRR